MRRMHFHTQGFARMLFLPRALAARTVSDDPETFTEAWLDTTGKCFNARAARCAQGIDSAYGVR